jgi:AbrB family looped-hinge helix DNA binding protein
MKRLTEQIEDAQMHITKISTKHQVTIPKEIFKRLHLVKGDMLEASEQGGRIVLTPKGLVNKAPTGSLQKKDQRILSRAREKIRKIQTDLINSRGLTSAEVKVAVKAGLIDPDQAYWWLEDWQEGERRAEEDIQRRRVKGPFDSAQELIDSLKS